MDSSGQYDPNDPNYPAANEGDIRDTAPDAVDRRAADIDGDTSYEGLMGEPSGASSGRTGVVGEPSGTGAGASGVAGSSRTDASYDPSYDPTQQNMNQGIGGLDTDEDMGGQGVNPQGYDTTNQGLGAQAADPDLSDQGYDDPSSARQP